MNLAYPIALLLSVVILHFISNAFGVYDLQIEAGFVWIDNVLHTLVGVAVGLFWLYFLNLRKTDASAVFRATSVIAVVLITAVLWELLELGFYLSMRTYAVSLNIYSPSILEAIEDIVSNTAGGLLVCIFVCCARKLGLQRPKA